MIYIVEDDAAIRELEQYALQSSGYDVQSFESSESFWQAMNAAVPELVILDVMLPGEDGFSILKKLRNTPSLRRLPIIMVTAKSSELDTVRGLDCGADYYLTKPFEPKELLACIRALTRRQPELRSSDTVEFGDLKLDKSAFTLSCGNRQLRLSRKEFDMMDLLMRNRDMVLTKETLLLKIWGYESDAEDNNVEVYVSFLRKKLDHLRSKVKIKTIRMVGYCLEVYEV